jgi:hypothetical protein
MIPPNPEDHTHTRLSFFGVPVVFVVGFLYSLACRTVRAGGLTVVMEVYTDLHRVVFWESWFAGMGKKNEAGLVIETNSPLEGHYIQSLWFVVVDGSDIVEMLRLLEEKHNVFCVWSVWTVSLLGSIRCRQRVLEHVSRHCTLTVPSRLWFLTTIAVAKVPSTLLRRHLAQLASSAHQPICGCGLAQESSTRAILYAW